jgi:2-succinyl-5-enolpyruvyl-6-hydroxy-3-cyclohexene-1-carboxylate synthase
MAVSMARARALGQGAPAGPVHVNAPFREPLWEQGATAIAAEAPPAVTSGPRRLDEAELDALAHELACERGVIVCGPLAPATLDDEALARSVGSLARTLGWPVIADAASGVRFGGEAPVVGFADAWLRCPEPAAAFAPERVLRVGLHPSSKSIAQWLAQHGRGRTVLVDTDGEWLDPAAAARRLVVAEPAWLFEALARRMEPQGRAWLARWQRIDEAAAEVLERACAEDGWEGAVARTVVEALPERAQLHLGSSMPIRDVDAFAPALDRRLRVHANRGCNGIDGSLSTALGEALAAPERPTVALLGDLTFLHDLDGLEAASMLAARLVVVVVHNRGGGIFRHLPIARHREAFDELFVTARDADIGALARAMGIAHALVEPRPAALRDALREAIERARPSILEVRIDPDHDLERHQRAWASVARAVEQEERKWK